MANAPNPQKVARKKAKAEAEASSELTIVVDGVKYPLRLDEFSAKDAGALRKACGLSIRGCIAALQTDPDLDIIAALVWLSRRQQGETVSYDEVAEELGYDSEVDYVANVDAADEDLDSPEA